MPSQFTNEGLPILTESFIGEYMNGPLKGLNLLEISLEQFKSLGKNVNKRNLQIMEEMRFSNPVLYKDLNVVTSSLIKVFPPENESFVKIVSTIAPCYGILNGQGKVYNPSYKLPKVEERTFNDVSQKFPESGDELYLAIDELRKEIKAENHYYDLFLDVNSESFLANRYLLEEIRQFLSFQYKLLKEQGKRDKCQSN